MGWWVSQLSVPVIAHKIRQRVIPNLKYLSNSQVRRCQVCRHYTVFLSLGPTEEFRLCLRCRANLRYELLAQSVRRLFPDLSTKDVLELDFSSPLRPLLSQARSYTRSFYRNSIVPGTIRADGAVCQDITRLTFADQSLDLIVSSDVLEHVPDAMAAFMESERVLRLGGTHLFTVPPRAATQPRALVRENGIEHLLQPEYHFDPLDPTGVLAYWDYGPDIQSVFAAAGLEFSVLLGPEGHDGRIVWAATKR